MIFEILYFCDKYYICDFIFKLLSLLDEVRYWFLNSKYKIVFKNCFIIEYKYLYEYKIVENYDG